MKNAIVKTANPVIKNVRFILLVFSLTYQFLIQFSLTYSFNGKPHRKFHP